MRSADGKTPKIGCGTSIVKFLGLAPGFLAVKDIDLMCERCWRQMIMQVIYQSIKIILAIALRSHNYDENVNICTTIRWA